MPSDRSREFFAGFRSTSLRIAVLATGWVLTAGGLGAVALGAVVSDLRLIGAGVMAALVAWLLSAMVPEPLPAPRADVQRRIEQIRKLEGHQLPA
jgi:hypothetical protein